MSKPHLSSNDYIISDMANGYYVTGLNESYPDWNSVVCAIRSDIRHYFPEPDIYYDNNVVIEQLVINGTELRTVIIYVK